MTPARQPQGYIITMGRIIKARNMLMVDGYHNADVLDRMVNLLRARPHTSPPAPEQGTSKLCFGTITLVAEECRKCNEIESCKQKQSILDYQKREIATEAAKAEREQVLRELTQRLDENIGSMEDCVVEMKNLRNINHTMNKIETFREVIGIAESLRAQHQGGVSE